MKSLNFGRMKVVALKEFRQIGRDRRSLGIYIFLPIFMLLMFGYALTYDVKEVRLGILDQSRTADSREFISKFTETEFFAYGMTVDRYGDADYLLDKRIVVAILVIPPDFSRKILAGSESRVQILVDGSNANEATQVQSYFSLITSQFNQKFRMDFLARNGQNQYLPMDIRPRIWYNPELRSSRYLVPGLIVYIMMLLAVISTAVSIVREKERRTLEQLMISPIKPAELILGKTIPYLIISLIAAYGILTAAWFLFGATVAGSHLYLFLIVLLFLIGALGLGLLISTIAPNQSVAFMIAAFVSVLPTILLSGFIFPIESMHPFLQAISLVIPGRYFLEALRFIIIKGAGPEAWWPDLVGLIVFVTIVLGITRTKLNQLIR